MGETNEGERWLAEACVPGRWWLSLGMIGRVAMIPLGSIVFVVQGYLTLAAWIAGGAGAILLVQGIALLARPRHRSRLARERAWLATLPFHVVKYERLFRDEEVRRGEWILGLRFAKKAPSKKRLEALFAPVATDVSVSLEGTDAEVRLTSPGLDTGGPGARYRLRLLFHQIADEILRPLHADHPIGSVEPES